MTDKELLELAAKAACIDPRRIDGVMRDHGVGYVSGLSKWNPLTDDGDALRLAVTLGLLGAPYMQLAWIAAMGEKNPHAATRRFIVLAAAEIGNE